MSFCAWVRRRRCLPLLLLVSGAGLMWAFAQISTGRISILSSRSKLHFAPVSADSTRVDLPTAAGNAPTSQSGRMDVDSSPTPTTSRETTGTALAETMVPPLGSTRQRVGITNDTLPLHFPSVFIIGFGKAGTKALYESLKMHPQLTGPKKEMRFFSLHFSRGLNWYLNNLPLPKLPNQFVIEKSPDYVTTKGVADRIRTAAVSLGVDPTSLKFIVVLRNPVARAVSEYLEWNVYRRIQRQQLLPPFSQLVLNSRSEVATYLRFINSSAYAYHIHAGNWLQIFSRSQFCFVNGDKFRVDPRPQVNKLEECLGLQPYFTDYNFVYNKEKKRYCLRDSNNIIWCLGMSKGRRHPHVPKSVIDKLKSYYKSWNRVLYRLLSEDFGWEESGES